MHFASDNTTGAHPAILQALMAAGDGPAMPYGNDPVTDAAIATVRNVFEAPEAAVLFVTTGTAANALALAGLVQPWETVFCHPEAHINVDECGAPEFFTAGSKLTLVEGPDARLTPDGLQEAIGATGAKGVHMVQPGAVSLTNATEMGAVYDPDALAALAQVAHGAGLPLHVDGTRFANAVSATGASPADLSWRAGVDVLCLGATKNGALAAEAVILFNPAGVADAAALAFRRKRSGHLLSKMRFVAAQMQAYLCDDLWLGLARHANDRARALADGLRGLAGVEILNPIDANLVFVRLPLALHRALQAAGAQYYAMPAHQSLQGPPDASLSVRLVTSYVTTAEEVSAFVEAARAHVPLALAR